MLYHNTIVSDTVLKLKVELKNHISNNITCTCTVSKPVNTPAKFYKFNSPMF